MNLNTVQHEFLGSTSAVLIEDNNQLAQLKHFLGSMNLFLGDGTPAPQLNMNVTTPVAFYRDVELRFVAYANPFTLTGYKLKKFNEMFPAEKEQVKVEQRSLFGDEESPGIKLPEDDLIVETEAHEVSNELTLAETLNQLTVGTITPAEVTGNIVEQKDDVIRAICQYKNIVVTKDNFKDLTATRADLNNKKKVLTENRKNIKEAALEKVNAVWDAMTDIIKTIDEVVKPLDADIKSFENAEKEALKTKIMNEQISPVLEMLVRKEMIDEETKNQFVFDKAWLLASAITKTGALTKKTQDAINNELQRLLGVYAQKLRDIEAIKSTVVQLCKAHNLETSLSTDAYIELYKKGVSMPEVQERINQDLEMIKKTVAETVQKIEPQQQRVEHEQDVKSNENVSRDENFETLVDEKTGEIIAKGNKQKIMSLVVGTPEKAQGKVYEYTYTFSGSFGAIKTFSNLLKLLSMIFEEFKYERVGK